MTQAETLVEILDGHFEDDQINAIYENETLNFSYKIDQNIDQMCDADADLGVMFVMHDKSQFAMVFDKNPGEDSLIGVNVYTFDIADDQQILSDAMTLSSEINRKAQAAMDGQNAEV